MGTDWISDHRCSFDLCAAALTGLEFDILLINIGVRTEVEAVEQRGARAFWNVDMPIAMVSCRTARSREEANPGECWCSDLEQSVRRVFLRGILNEII